MLDWWTHQPGRSCSLWLYAFLPCTAAAGGLIFDVCMVLSLMSVNLTVKLPDTLNAGQGPTRPTDLPCHLLPLCGASRLLHGVCPLPLELLDNEPDSGGRLVTQGGDHNRSWKVVGKTSGLVRRGLWAYDHPHLERDASVLVLKMEAWQWRAFDLGPPFNKQNISRMLRSWQSCQTPQRIWTSPPQDSHQSIFARCHQARDVERSFQGRPNQTLHSRPRCSKQHATARGPWWWSSVFFIWIIWVHRWRSGKWSWGRSHRSCQRMGPRNNHVSKREKQYRPCDCRWRRWFIQLWHSTILRSWKNLLSKTSESARDVPSRSPSELLGSLHPFWRSCGPRSKKF